MKQGTMFVTLKVPSDMLKEISQFPAPKTTKGKATTKNTKKTTVALPSPTPDPLTAEGTPSASSATMKMTSLSRVQNADDLKLDKSGKQVRKWAKKPFEIQSFTGYFMNFKSWTGGQTEGEQTTKNDQRKPLKIQIRLNNKNLGVKQEESATAGEAPSREDTPLGDDNSSIMSTPEGSRMSTPAL